MAQTMEEQLRQMIAEGRLSKETVCLGAGVTEEQLDWFLSGELRRLRVGEWSRLLSLTACLGPGLTEVDPDERVWGMLTVLLEEYRFRPEALRLLLGAKEGELQALLERGPLDPETRYRLAVGAFSAVLALMQLKLGQAAGEAQGPIEAEGGGTGGDF